MHESYALRIWRPEECGYHALEVFQGNGVFTPMGETLIPGEVVGGSRDPEGRAA